MCRETVSSSVFPDVTRTGETVFGGKSRRLDARSVASVGGNGQLERAFCVRLPANDFVIVLQ